VLKEPNLSQQGGGVYVQQFHFVEMYGDTTHDGRCLCAENMHEVDDTRHPNPIELIEFWS
jgi:hypothetical protein